MQDIGAITDLSHHAGALFFCDGAQAPGRVPLALRDHGVDLCSLTAHKCYGPKGVGALIVRSGTPITSLFKGGGQERGLRPGTTAVPMVVALGACLTIAEEERIEDETRLAALRTRLWVGLSTQIEGLRVNGSLEARVGGNLNIVIPCVDAATLMIALPELAISAGSACSSGTPKPSHVLKAIGCSDEDALCSIRLGLGRGTTEAEVTFAISRITEAAHNIRAASPLWAMRQAGMSVQW